jgi:hypothetical protein
MILSVFAENTFATRWLDGVTKLFDDTTWHYIWEQGYATLDEAEAAEGSWREHADGMVDRSLELWYRLEVGEGYENEAGSARVLSSAQAR